MSDSDIACHDLRDIGLNQSRGYRLSAVSRMLDELTVPSRERQLFALRLSKWQRHV